VHRINGRLISTRANYKVACRFIGDSVIAEAYDSFAAFANLSFHLNASCVSPISPRDRFLRPAYAYLIIEFLFCALSALVNAPGNTGAASAGISGETKRRKQHRRLRRGASPDEGDAARSGCDPLVFNARPIDQNRDLHRRYYFEHVPCVQRAPGNLACARARARGV